MFWRVINLGRKVLRLGRRKGHWTSSLDAMRSHASQLSQEWLGTRLIFGGAYFREFYGLYWVKPPLYGHLIYGQFALSLGKESPYIFSTFNPLNADIQLIRTLSPPPPPPPPFLPPTVPQCLYQWRSTVNATHKAHFSHRYHQSKCHSTLF